MKKSVMLAISMVMIVSMLAGCAPQATEAPTTAPVEPTTAPVQPTSAPVQPTTAPVEPTTAPVEPVAPAIPAEVNVAIAADPADLSPFVGMSMGRIAVLRTIYEYLFDRPQMGGDLVPFIAKSVEQTGDKAYVVTLFENVVDSAGNHITAADAAWSYNTGMTAGNLRPLGDIESVTATGDYTVEFVFKDVLGIGALEGVLTECPIVSQASFEASPDQFATKPITSSPYELMEFVPGSSLTFEKRADYWQTDATMIPVLSQANVQKIVFQIITEPSQHAIALETGTADISGNVSGDDITLFEGKAGFTLSKFQDNLTQILAFNGSEGNPFTKLELRQAVAYAIDTTAMCEAVAPGACGPAHSTANSNFGDWLEKWDTEPYYEFDLAKAQELLATAGYKPGDLTFKLLVQNDPTSGLMAQVIQAELATLGITVNIDAEESSVYNTLAYDPTAFDMVINAAASRDFVVNVWKLSYEAARYNGTTSNFFVDDQLQELLTTAGTVDGHTPENMDAFQQYAKEQAYMYGLLSRFNFVVGVDGITKVVRDGRGQLIPGAFEFSADF